MNATEREARVREILAEHLMAVDDGVPVTAEELLARHPEFRQELLAFFAQDDSLRRRSDGPVEQATPTWRAERAAAADAPPPHFGDYEILQEWARGGMGVVYKARQRGAQRLVALKMIRQASLAGKEDLLRFRAEAEAAAQLDHPNIVPIHDVGERDGHPYYTMAWVPGGTLAEHLQEYVARPRASARLIATVSRAVHHAHRRGILHRDLKPGNILLKELDVPSPRPADVLHVPFVVDFGLAKRLDLDSNLTRSGAIVGTPNYMAPEQAAGRKDLTTAADIYALGTILYELLTGRKPFQAETPMATLLLVQQQEPESVRALAPRIDADLATICAKAMRKEPEERYASAEDLAEDLEDWLAGEPIRARATTWTEAAARWARRRPAVAALLLLVLVTNTVGFALVAVNWREAVRQRGEADQQRSEAMQRTREAEEARQTTQDALNRAEGLLYFSSLASAQNEWANDNSGRALRFLDDGPVSLRGWEWRFLRRLYQGSRWTYTGAGTPAALDSQGGRLAARHGESILVWSMRDGTEIARLPGRATALAWNADGRLVTADAAALKVWNLGGTVDREFAIEGARCSLSADGGRLAVLRPDRVAVWDVAAGREIRAWPTKAQSILGVPAFDATGKTLAIAKRGETIVWNVDENALKCELQTKVVDGKALSPDGSLLATSHLVERRVTIWDLAAAKARREVTLDAAVGGLHFSADGRNLILPGSDGTIRIVNVDDGSVTEKLRGHPPHVTTEAVVAADNKVAVATSEPAVRVWERDVELGLRFPARIDPGPCFAFSADSRLLAWIDAKKSVRIHDFATERTRPLRLDVPVSVLEFTPAPGRALLAAGGPADLVLFDADADAVEEKRRLPCQGLAFDRAGTRLAAFADQEIILLEVPRLNVLRKSTAPARVDWTKPIDDDRLLVALSDKLVEWDASTGKEASVLVGQGVRAPVASAHGELVLFRSGAMLETWDTRTGKRQAQVSTGRESYSSGLSPDLRRVVWGQGDGTVKIADLESGRDVLTLRCRTNFLVPAVTSVRFSPDGRRLAAHAPTQITVWEAGAD